MTEAEAAQALRVHPDTLTRWRSDGRSPRYIKIGSAVRYRLADLYEYVDLCAVNPVAHAEIEAAQQVSAVIA